MVKFWIGDTAVTVLVRQQIEPDANHLVIHHDHLVGPHDVAILVAAIDRLRAPRRSDRRFHPIDVVRIVGIAEVDGHFLRGLLL